MSKDDNPTRKDDVLGCRFCGKTKRVFYNNDGKPVFLCDNDDVDVIKRWLGTGAINIFPPTKEEVEK